MERIAPEQCNQTCDLLGKILLIGDSGVGKSSLLYRLTNDRFLINASPTIGVEFAALYYRVPDTDTVVKIQIWDCAGQTRFQSIVKSYFRQADIVIFVYDLTDRQSFLNLKGWAEKSEQELQDKPHLNCIIGNKSDATDATNDSSVIDVEDIHKFAKDINAALNVKMSAKDSGEPIANVISTCLRMAYDQYEKGVPLLRGSIYRNVVKLEDVHSGESEEEPYYPSYKKPGTCIGCLN